MTLPKRAFPEQGRGMLRYASSCCWLVCRRGRRGPPLPTSSFPKKYICYSTSFTAGLLHAHRACRHRPARAPPCGADPRRATPATSSRAAARSSGAHLRLLACLMHCGAAQTRVERSVPKPRMAAQHTVSATAPSPLLLRSARHAGRALRGQRDGGRTRAGSPGVRVSACLRALRTRGQRARVGHTRRAASARARSSRSAGSTAGRRPPSRPPLGDVFEANLTLHDGRCYTGHARRKRCRGRGGRRGLDLRGDMARTSTALRLDPAEARGHSTGALYGLALERRGGCSPSAASPTFDWPRRRRRPRRSSAAALVERPLHRRARPRHVARRGRRVRGGTDPAAARWGSARRPPCRRRARRAQYVDTVVTVAASPADCAPWLREHCARALEVARGPDTEWVPARSGAPERLRRRAARDGALCLVARVRDDERLPAGSGTCSPRRRCSRWASSCAAAGASSRRRGGGRGWPTTGRRRGVRLARAHGLPPLPARRRAVGRALPPLPRPPLRAQGRRRPSA